MCEAMNACPRFDNSSFFAANTLNAKPGTAEGEVISAGLFDSYTGPECASFVSKLLQRAFETHAIVPQRLKQQLRTTSPQDPLHSIRLRLLQDITKHTGDSIFSADHMQLYASSADAAFFHHCNLLNKAKPSSDKVKDGVTKAPVEESGCRGVWFCASLRSSSDGEPFVDLTTANVGNCRAFGIALDPSTPALSSPFDDKKLRLVPLAVDHSPHRQNEFARVTRAGGRLCTENNFCIDGNPYMNVTRSFGHWSMKCNEALSPSEQKMISTPSAFARELRGGDVIVLANASVFDTRGADYSTVESIAEVVERTLKQGADTQAAASAAIDFSMRFGGTQCSQVVVAQISKDLKKALHSGESLIHRAESVDPGPVHPGACHAVPGYYAALVADARRCGMELSDLLLLRYLKMKDLFASEPAHPLSSAFPKDFGHLMQLFEEEKAFFECGSELTAALQRGEDDMKAHFSMLSKKLAPLRAKSR